MDMTRLKIKEQLLEHDIISYAMDHIELPKGGIDCSEGCNPYGFPPECAEVLKNIDPARLGPYPHSDALHDAIAEFWKDQINVERDNILLTDGSITHSTSSTISLIPITRSCSAYPHSLLIITCMPR